MVAGKLQSEIKQARPFDSLEQETFLSLARTVDVLEQEVAKALQSIGISPTQYNALRILRGAPPEGLPCGEIASRMVRHDPDITRLLDRLEKRGLVTRQRSTADRRVVRIRISEVGREALATADGPVAAALARRLGSLGPNRLRTMIDDLETARAGDSEGGSEG